MQILSQVPKETVPGFGSVWIPILLPDINIDMESQEIQRHMDLL